MCLVTHAIVSYVEIVACVINFAQVGSYKTFVSCSFFR